MKKKFMFVALVSLFSAGVLFTSCEKEEESCYCTIEINYEGTSMTVGEGGFLTEDYGVINCAQLTEEIQAEYEEDEELAGIATIKCVGE